MQIGSVIAVYFVFWWLTLFAVLPFGIRSQQEAGEVTAGTDPGAPAIVRIRRIVIINSMVAALLMAIFWLVYVENYFNIALLNEIVRR